MYKNTYYVYIKEAYIYIFILNCKRTQTIKPRGPHPQHHAWDCVSYIERNNTQELCMCVLYV